MYQKALVLVAYRNEGTGPSMDSDDEIWSTRVTLEDRRDDLEDYLPILVAAGVYYYGVNNDSPIKLKMAKDSRVLNYVRHGVAEREL